MATKEAVSEGVAVRAGDLLRRDACVLFYRWDLNGASSVVGMVTRTMKGWKLGLVLGLLAAGCAVPTQPPMPTVEPTVSAEVIRTALPTVPPTVTPTPQPTLTVVQATARPEPTVTPTQSFPDVTITLVYDNNPYDERLETAWGFSCLVEGLEETILFDTGGDGAMLLRNMQAAGADPLDVDVVVVSHVHGDHVGGLSGFLEENHGVSVYLPQSFPREIKDDVGGAGARVEEVGESLVICQHALVTGELGTRIKEQALVLETSRGLVVITGCAHPGITDIVRRARELVGQDIYLVLGGFHLGGASPTTIDGIIEEFRELGVQKVAPCHCTGDEARRRFGEVYREDYIPAGVGSRLEVQGR
jgi:7,8-dihydropterin-6-yl-methyl-4-(beta-D-ribofuranosyl)aminobenzene 5'-phosphate synthase